MMYGATVDVLEVLGDLTASSVIPWACPVPFFGEISRARVATVGINPSSHEFINLNGSERDGVERRLPTLRSLGLRSWSDADARHIRAIIDACAGYFRRNPYDRWFKVLDQIVSATDRSFYSDHAPACHLDLVPYATSERWASLTNAERQLLMERSRHAVGQFVRDSVIDLLILNGSSVVRAFEELSGAVLVRSELPGSALPRNDGAHVPGVGYYGTVESLGGIHLDRDIVAIGYNHNIQSSFGVTSAAVVAIGAWVRAVTGGRS